VRTGASLAGTTNGVKSLIELVRNYIGNENYPEFFDTPVGKVLEPIIVCGVVNILAENINFPKSEMVSRAAELGLTGSIKDAIQPYFAHLGPFMSQFLSIMSTMIEEKEEEGEDENE